MTPRHQAARELAAQGIPIFPCRGKIPVTARGFESESADPETIDCWWNYEDYNIGVRPFHMGLVAIDLDHAKPGGVSQAVIDSLPPTRTHRTPSGGEHRLYLSLETYGNRVAAQNVDVRSEKGYILWPPSEGYTVESDSLAMLPDSWAQHLRGDEQEQEAVQVDDTGVDAMLEEARAWCAHLATLGDYDRFALAAGLVRNFGLTDTTATALCEEFGLRTWSTNESPTTWQQTLVNARRFGKGSLGEGVAFQYPEPGPIPEAWKIAAAPKSNNRFGGRTPSEGENLMEITYWDKYNTFPKLPCVGMVIGESGSHKSGLLLKYGLDIVEAGGRVIYFAAEGARGIETARIPKARDLRMLDRAKLDGAWRTESESFNLLSPADQDLFYEAYKDFKPNAIFMDVLTLFTNVDINTPQGSAAIMLAANQMAYRFNCPVVFAHHPGKDKSRGSLGGTLLQALAYFEWRVELNGDKVWLTVTKMKDGEAHFSVPFGINSVQGVPVIVECEHLPEAVQPPHPVALAIRDFLDTTSDTEFFDLEGMVKELRTKHIIPPGIHNGRAWLKQRLDGIGEYMTKTGEGIATSYCFRKPTKEKGA